MAAPSKPYQLSIDTKRTVIRLSGLDPYVGLESSASIEGFQYDLKAWEASPIDETVEPFAVLPRYLQKPLVAIPESYYQSGIQGDPLSAADLELQTIELGSHYVPTSEPIEDDLYSSLSGVNYQKPWLPKLWHGTYYLNDEDYFLYSDESVVQTIDPAANRSNRNYLLLEKTPKSGTPISIKMYQRDAEWVPRTYREIKIVEKFSGRADDGEELETESVTGEVDWDNVETNIPEAKISLELSTPSLIFNNDWTKTIGYEPAEYNQLADLEVLGVVTTQANQKFYTKYFPILNGDVSRVYLVDYTGEGFIEWTRVDDFDSSGPVDEHYVVDNDYGIIQFGDGTNGAIPTEGYYVYITYQASLRVEYEEDETTNLVTGFKANVSPVSQSLNAGFVTVSGYDDSPDTITLEASLSPVEVATDLSFLTATVLSRAGRPCRDIDVYFEFTADSRDLIGSIGGIRAPGLFLGRTNASGEARTYYRPPSSIEDMTWYTSTVSGGTSLVLPAGAEVSPLTDDYIFTYAIYRDDPLMGKAGADTSIGEVAWTTDPRPNGRKVLLYVQTTSNSWKDPITGIAASGPTPVWRPLIPSAYDSDTNELTYSHTFVEPETGDTVVDTWIGGYAVIVSKIVTIRAYCFSERLGTYIFSNEVDIVVILPERMRGTYVQSGKEKIPFGWRIYDDSYTIASAITAATYLGINPRAGAYPIIDVIGDETWDGTSPSDSSDEAEYAFGRLHFVFEVT